LHKNLGTLLTELTYRLERLRIFEMAEVATFSLLATSAKATPEIFTYPIEFRARTSRRPPFAGDLLLILRWKPFHFCIFWI